MSLEAEKMSVKNVWNAISQNVSNFRGSYRRQSAQIPSMPNLSMNLSFEQQMARLRMKPDTVVRFGQNSFAYDSAKKKVWVQSAEVPEGVLLKRRELASYALLADGLVMPGGSLSESCSQIGLRLETKKKTYPQILLALMPFRFERPQARKDAIAAARAIAHAADSILGGQD